MVPVTLAAVLWPWLTLATLLIFRRTLRRARINFGHLVRVVVYAAVPLVLCVPLSALVAVLLDAAGVFDEITPTYSTQIGQLLGVPPLAPLLALTLLLLCAGYSLAQAHRLYLRLPQPVAAAVASQVVVWLALVAFLNLCGGWV